MASVYFNPFSFPKSFLDYPGSGKLGLSGAGREWAVM